MSVELVRLTDHLFVIPGVNGGRFPGALSFYVQDDVRALIDTGCGIDVLKQLKSEYDVDLVINSHGHPDHSAGNWVFGDRPLWAPIEGADSHGRAELLSERLAEPGALAKTWRAYVRDTMGFGDSQPTDYFQNGHRFHFGKLTLEAVHTPGHTRDHYCFFDERNGLLLTFDIDLTSFGPYYGHRESDIGQFRDSLDKVRRLRPKTVAPSHREPVSGPDIGPALNRYEAVFDRRSRKILGLITDGATMDELVELSPIYGGVPYAPELIRYWEGRMIEKHLDDMIGRGLVKKDGDKFIAV